LILYLLYIFLTHLRWLLCQVWPLDLEDAHHEAFGVESVQAVALRLRAMFLALEALHAPGTPVLLASHADTLQVRSARGGAWASTTRRLVGCRLKLLVMLSDAVARPASNSSPCREPPSCLYMFAVLRCTLSPTCSFSALACRCALCGGWVLSAQIMQCLVARADVRLFSQYRFGNGEVRTHAPLCRTTASAYHSAFLCLRAEPSPGFDCFALRRCVLWASRRTPFRRLSPSRGTSAACEAQAVCDSQ
jgi:hypothetical protein